MKGGKGLDKFREEMMNDKRIKFIYDFESSKEIFTGLHIDGGVCYFLWEKNYHGPVDYHYHSLDGTINNSKRFLKTDFSETVIRDPRQISIIEKISKKNEAKFNLIISEQKPYGFRSFLFNKPELYPDAKLTYKEKGDFLKIHGIKGNKGGAKRVIGYVDPKSVTKGEDYIKSYKLFFSKAYMTTSTVPPEIILAKPKEICTETFLNIGSFDTEEEAKNCLSYIKTKFFRALLFFNRHSLNISQSSFKLIPLQEFSESWTDEKLYKKYNLTKEEIDFIESMIKPME
jgi:hypothetical protein